MENGMVSSGMMPGVMAAVLFFLFAVSLVSLVIYINRGNSAEH